jgi:hypothetical protein
VWSGGPLRLDATEKNLGFFVYHKCLLPPADVKNLSGATGRLVDETVGSGRAHQPMV